MTRKFSLPRTTLQFLAITLTSIIITLGLGELSLIERTTGILDIYVIVLLVLLVGGIILVLYGLTRKVEDIKIDDKEFITIEFFANLWLLIYYSIFSAEFFRVLYVIAGGFTAKDAEIGTWSLYGVYWLLNGLTANALDIFNLPVTTIKAVALWSQLLVLSSNIFLGILIGSVFRYVRLMREVY